MKKMHRVLSLFLILFLLSCSPKSSSNFTATNPSDYQVSISFGSCNKHTHDQSYWDQIMKRRTDLWVWLGDIIYADTENMDKMKRMYDGQKSNPQYASFISNIPVAGIWDDHDYGVNDGGKDYLMKEDSKELLFDFLDIPPDHASRTHDGAYQSYMIAANDVTVKLILLDGRYFRDTQVPDPSGEKRYLEQENASLLGEAQWKWFEDQIRDSDADFHVIGTGIQALPVDHGYEKWSNYASERQRLIDLLNLHQPAGTVIISGDRHIAEISRIETNMDQKYLYDITSSGLTHSYQQNSSEKEPNRFRIGELISEKNYGVLRFNKGKKAYVEVEIWGMENNLLLRHTIRF